MTADARVPPAQLAATPLMRCPNCLGSGSLPLALAFAGICGWCDSSGLITEAQLRRRRELAARAAADAPRGTDRETTEEA